MRISVLLLALLACEPEARWLPSVDAVTAPAMPHGLRVANWNLEWFGTPGRGPVDDALQIARAQAVLATVDAQLWVVAEISNPAAFAELVARSPGYRGLLASDPEVALGSRYYSGEEQRVGLVYDPRQVQVRSARLILTEHAYDFAGRPPMAVDLHLSLREGSIDLTVIALHLKAFADAPSYARRQRSAQALLDYLSALPPSQAVLVAGDWNDGLLGSTLPGQGSPFQALLEQPELHFWTEALAADGVSSYAGGHTLIDHQLANSPLDAVWVPGSTQVWPIEALAPDFVQTTSDHFPVSSELDLHRALSINEILANEPGRDRAQEMVELLNTSCARVRLDGLRLGVEGGPSLALDEPSLAEGSARAIRSARGLGLNNQGATVLLTEPSGTVLEQVRYPARLAALDGVSMNRIPDGSRSLEWRLHREVADADSSPGLRVDGRPFACP